LDKDLDIEAIVAKLGDGSNTSVPTGDDEAAQTAAVAAQLEQEAATNTDPAETQTIGEEAGQNDPAAAEQKAVEPPQPTIEPPKSWDAEARAVFAQLPPHLQQKVADRVREQDAEFRRQQNEAAEARKAAEAERTRIAEDRQKALQYADTVINAAINTDPIIAEGKAIDWPRLATTDPDTYAAKKAIFDDRVQKLAQAIQQRDQLAQQVQADAQKATQERLAKEHQALMDKVQEWRDDPEKARTAVRDVITHANKRYGISEQEFAQVGDHRAILMMHDNMRMARELEELKAENVKLKTSRDATLKEIELKRAAAPAPKTAAPKAASEVKGPSDQTKALLNHARRSGRDSDRVAAVMAALSGAS
jgi:hypothetical protein